MEAIDELLPSPANGFGASEVAGVLTKTIIHSPVIRYILHARIRERHLNDVVFVGDDFIHVKQVKQHGPLLHVHTKTGFYSRIRAARVFSNESDRPDEDFFVKTEDDTSLRGTRPIPPQFLVLTLDSNEIVFLYLSTNGRGGYDSVEQAFPMPAFDRVLYQPGEHLAIDPRYRAIAVAAMEKEVVIYATKAQEQIGRELQARDPNWCPISAQRPIRVEGAIQLMDFLVPGREDTDHVMLLLIVIVQKRTKAVLVEWAHTAGLHDAQIRAALPLDSSQGPPNLLIPLRNAAFLLANGFELTQYENLVSGSVKEQAIAPTTERVENEGASPRLPMWTSWCRPQRNHYATQSKDSLYLAREDGHIFLLTIAGTVWMSHAEDLQCHIGTAFASLGDSRNPDILAAAGDMSPGRIITIGIWSDPMGVETRTRSDTMHPEPIDSIQNWASVTDMVTTSLHEKPRRARDGVFVTSGRQPYGCVTELRRGLEAQALFYGELGRPVKDVWALPLIATGEVLFLLSSPEETLACKLWVENGETNMEGHHGSSMILDLACPTLAAGVTLSQRIVQVTAKSICVQSGIEANFEDSSRQEVADGRTILAATIHDTLSMIVTGERLPEEEGGCAIAIYTLPADGMASDSLKRQSVYTLPEQILAIALSTTDDSPMAAASTADGKILLFTVGETGIARFCVQTCPSSLPDEQGICDSMVILQPKAKASSSGVALVVCGLRDGRIYSVRVQSNKDEVKILDDSTINISHSNVKLSKPSTDCSFVYAMSEAEFCLLSWERPESSSVSVESVWISDKERPHARQAPVNACTHMPSADLISPPYLADSLVTISGNDICLASLERNPVTVPRRIPVSGTPNRLLYAEQHRCLVCASLQFGVRKSLASPPSRRKEKRSVWPVIDFIPSRSDRSSYTHHMQPGERVYALLEWTYTPADHNAYSFVLVAGSCRSSSGAQRGRIMFLQPSIKSWEVTGVKEGFVLSFDAPVYALALFDEMTIVACVGQRVLVHRFSIESRKWQLICTSPVLASIGSFISVTRPRIYVSTLEDSLVVLELSANEDGTGKETYTLRPDILAPRAAALLNHLAPVGRVDKPITTSDDLALLTTKYGELTGLRFNENQHSRSAQLLFETSLPRSLTRLRQCNIRPLWKRARRDGVLADDILGCAPDGTIVGVAVLDQKLLRQLGWLQRLCEWSEEMAQPTHHSTSSTMPDDLLAEENVGVSIGLRGGGNRVSMPVNGSRLVDRHIDGDVLEKVLGHGSVGRLKDLIKQAAKRDDSAGLWVKEHLQEELEAADEIFSTLIHLLDSWM